MRIAILGLCLLFSGGNLFGAHKFTHVTQRYVDSILLSNDAQGHRDGVIYEWISFESEHLAGNELGGRCDCKLPVPKIYWKELNINASQLAYRGMLLYFNGNDHYLPIAPCISQAQVESYRTQFSEETVRLFLKGLLIKDVNHKDSKVNNGRSFFSCILVSDISTDAPKNH